MCILCDYNSKIVGKFLGYPRCCIKWHERNTKKYRNDPDKLMDDFTVYQEIIQNKTFGIGFVPCPTCAKKVVENNLPLEILIKNRICSVPFPYAGDDELSIKEFKEYIKQIK